MMDRSVPDATYQFSRKIGPLVRERKIFERFLPYMGVVAILAFGSGELIKIQTLLPVFPTVGLFVH